MGKKNKKNSSMEINEGIETKEANVPSLLKISNMTYKDNMNKSNGQHKLKHKQHCISNDNEPDNKTEKKNQTQKLKRNKRKSEDAELNKIASTCEQKVKSNKRKPGARDAKTKNQNIVFAGDIMTKEDIPKPPKAKFLNEDEAEVRDEDIISRNKRKPGARDAKTKNQNIVFAGDIMTKEDIPKPPKAKFLNEDEAEVRDEDIDKFCEEITEEDNKTYENWVEMFEANFKKIKK